MYNYQNFVPRIDTAPRVKYPMISEVYFAWCKCQDQQWEEGDILTNPSEPATSIQELEEHRASNFEYDYEKGYYEDHYAMLVLKYRQGDKEYKLFLTPEHAVAILKHGVNCDDHLDKGIMIQPEYSWNELNLEGLLHFETEEKD
tara:strand:+ start:524 stop:955 length:432 start_codon:yes stop_codon:yes gene_type:complete